MKKITGCMFVLTLLPTISQAEPVNDMFYALSKLSTTENQALVAMTDNQLTTVEGTTNSFTDLSSLWRNSATFSEGVNNRIVLSRMPNVSPTQAKASPSKPQSAKNTNTVRRSGVNYAQITQIKSSSNATNSANISQN